jgi:phenylpyruvate tautomerase PptA (4-oxalocrotonate tautomerase family)
MPVISIALMEGYEESVRERIAHHLTCAVGAVLEAPAEVITVMIQEVASANYRRGDQRRRQAAAPPDAAVLVKEFLGRMEARNLEGARSMLAEDFEMVFPGNARFKKIEELVEWAKKRYHWVRKRYETFDLAPQLNGSVVYCFGVLDGEDLKGRPFADIRFIDRFTVRKGLLQNQQVWNDLAASGVIGG